MNVNKLIFLFIIAQTVIMKAQNANYSSNLPNENMTCLYSKILDYLSTNQFYKDEETPIVKFDSCKKIVFHINTSSLIYIDDEYEIGALRSIKMIDSLNLYRFKADFFEKIDFGTSDNYIVEKDLSNLQCFEVIKIILSPIYYSKEKIFIKVKFRYFANINNTEIPREHEFIFRS